MLVGRRGRRPCPTQASLRLVAHQGSQQRQAGGRSASVRLIARKIGQERVVSGRDPLQAGVVIFFRF